MKTCICERCKKRKAATTDKFPRNGRRESGIGKICRLCVRAAKDGQPETIKLREKERLRRSYQAKKDIITERRDARRKANLPKFAEQQRKWRAKQTPEKRETARLKARIWYVENRERALLYHREKREKLRAEMITAYGGECQCCGEKNQRFLTVDHTNGGGNAHRKAASGSSNVIFDLKRKGWPKDDYQLLCYNCNCGRAHNGGVCPHITAGNRSV